MARTQIDHHGTGFTCGLLCPCFQHSGCHTDIICWMTGLFGNGMVNPMLPQDSGPGAIDQADRRTELTKVGGKR